MPPTSTGGSSDADSALMSAVLAAISRARRDPSSCAGRIRARLAHFSGKDYADPGRPGRVKVTKEGGLAVRDALQYLSQVEPERAPFFRTEQEPGLELSAGDHGVDIGGTGLVSHTGADGSCVSDRQGRYGSWEGKCGECLWYGKMGGWVTGESIVDDLIIDDGVKSRGHRLCIFDRKYHIAGAAQAPHKVFGHVIVIEFAGSFDPEDGLIATRLAAGPHHPALPDPVAQGRGQGGRTQGVPAIATQWKDLGKCGACGQTIHGGEVVETEQGRRKVKYHAACWSCRGCGCSLVGVGRKEEAGAVYCNPCWIESFAPDCAHCAKKVAAGGIRLTSGAIFHKECRAAAKAKAKSPTAAPGPPRATASARRSRAPQGFLKQLDGQPGQPSARQAHTQTPRAARPRRPGGTGSTASGAPKPKQKSRAKPNPKPKTLSLDGARHKMESIGMAYGDLA